jgi:hypothetical protein
MDMKGDGRSLDYRTLETIRLRAVKRLRDGEPAAKVIEAYEFNLSRNKTVEACFKRTLRSD